MYPKSTSERLGASVQHPPVILLLSNQARERDAVDRWLTDSRYTTCEAVDIFQALEQFSDFTTGERPDVIFLHVDADAPDLRAIQLMFATSAGDSDVPMIDFAKETNLGRSERDLEETIKQLICRLDEFIPERDVSRN